MTTGSVKKCCLSCSRWGEHMAVNTNIRWQICSVPDVRGKLFYANADYLCGEYRRVPKDELGSWALAAEGE